MTAPIAPMWWPWWKRLLYRIGLFRSPRALVEFDLAETGYLDGLIVAPMRHERTDTLTCPRCRRAWPLVTFIGRTRCPGCGSLVLGWQ